MPIVDGERSDNWKGVVAPSPACKRALSLTIDALKARGDEVVDL